MNNQLKIYLVELTVVWLTHSPCWQEELVKETRMEKTLLDFILENTERGVLAVIPESFWRLSDEEYRIGHAWIREHVALVHFAEEEGQLTAFEWNIMHNPDVREAIMNNHNVQILANVLQDIKLNMKPIDDVNNNNSQNVEDSVATIPIQTRRPAVFKSDILCHDCAQTSNQLSEKVEGVAGNIPLSSYTTAFITVAYGVFIMSILQITSSRMFHNISRQLAARIGSLIPEVTLPIPSVNPI